MKEQVMATVELYEHVNSVGLNRFVVTAIDKDNRSHLTSFSGPDAETLAREYIRFKYSSFQPVVRA